MLTNNSYVLEIIDRKIEYIRFYKNFLQNSLFMKYDFIKK